jgi:hypothetical protein
VLAQQVHYIESDPQDNYIENVSEKLRTMLCWVWNEHIGHDADLQNFVRFLVCPSEGSTKVRTSSLFTSKLCKFEVDILEEKEEEEEIQHEMADDHIVDIVFQNSQEPQNVVADEDGFLCTSCGERHWAYLCQHPRKEGYRLCSSGYDKIEEEILSNIGDTRLYFEIQRETFDR